jgi:hypothetical protein
MMIVFPTLLTYVFTEDTIVFPVHGYVGTGLQCLRHYKDKPQNIYLENQDYPNDGAEKDIKEFLVTTFKQPLINNVDSPVSLNIQTANKDISFFVTNIIYQVIYLFLIRANFLKQNQFLTTPQFLEKFSDIVCFHLHRWDCLYRTQDSADIFLYSTKHHITRIHVKDRQIKFLNPILFDVVDPRSIQSIDYFLQRSYKELGATDTPLQYNPTSGNKRRRRKLHKYY